jgi:uncharacterized protein
MGKFILTGSQNFLLLEKITPSLAGRVAVLHLMPFTINELDKAGFLEDEVDRLLFTGAYPVLYDRQVAAPDYYPSYIQTYIERDVRSINKYRRPDRVSAICQTVLWPDRPTVKSFRPRR